MNNYNLVFLNSYLTQFREKLPDACPFDRGMLFIALDAVGIHHAQINGQESDKFYRWELDDALASRERLSKIEKSIKHQKQVAADAMKPAPAPVRQRAQKPLSKKRQYEINRENYLRDVERRREEERLRIKKEYDENRSYDPYEDMDWLINHYGIDDDFSDDVDEHLAIEFGRSELMESCDVLSKSDALCNEIISKLPKN